MVEGLAPPSTCVPLGGTLRSAMSGGFYLITGVGEGTEEFGHGGLIKGAGMVGVGLAALVVDTPLSFIGDVVTLPVASARQQGAPWATWWGDQAAPKTPAPVDVVQRPSAQASAASPASQATAVQPAAGPPAQGIGQSDARRWPD
jgi:hypothetical protein